MLDVTEIAHRNPTPLPSRLCPKSLLPPWTARRIVVISTLALATIGLLTAILLQRPNFALAIFGLGVVGGITLAVGKRVLAKILGYQDRSLAEMAYTKLGHVGIWGTGGLVTSATLPVFPMASFGMAGTLAGEHVANNVLNVIEQIPYHANGLASFIRVFHEEYPNGWKYILGGATALVGLGIFIYVLPGSNSYSIFGLKIPSKILETVGGLMLGLIAIGTVRIFVASKRNGQDPGNISSSWEQASIKERLGKAAVGLGSAAIFGMALIMLFQFRSNIEIAYLMTGAATSGALWIAFPSLPLRSARGTYKIVKKLTNPARLVHNWFAPKAQPDS